MWTTYIRVTTTSRGRGNALAGPAVKRVSTSACRAVRRLAGERWAGSRLAALGGAKSASGPPCGSTGRPERGSWSIVDPWGYTSDHDPGVRTPVAASPSFSGAKSALGHQFRSSVRPSRGFGPADATTWSIDHSPLWANFHLTKMAGDDGGDDVLDSGILASVWCGRTATAWLRGCQSASTDEGLRRSPGSRSRVTPGRLYDAASH